ncbi:unnamed protein product [Lepeophtheirus salmonis]|uniref:(salmon louse) hypothetical protein n=1 Tax=Lepeophtheirus salmonis TaxID=72036 RepID=A0A7R8HDE3_LEPSM|nr:unnamed protein product [Lepeophtheirus salmonis]CAF3028180.1 unnamed protein product [Lepeophtheirus salmonis]
MLGTLAFIPVENAFEALCENDIFPNKAQDLIDYIKETWIDRPDRRRSQRSHKIWNVYNLVLENIPKTNNNVEGWFEEQMASFHPNIWKFLECVKKEQTSTKVKIEQYVGGYELNEGRKI